MNTNLEMMLNNTKTAVEKAKNFADNQKRIKLEEKEERKTLNYDPTCREVIMIKSLGLNIDLFEPADPNDDSYDSPEYYYCSNDRWKVFIRNIFDTDLGSVLQVLDLIDKTTDEKVHFYCDLWCKNTPKTRIEQLNVLLNCSAQEFIDQEFGIYYSLPQLLRERGFTVEEKDYSFDTDKCKGFLKIKNESMSQTTCELVISHYNIISTFLRNQTDKFSFADKLIYYFTYNGEQCIEELSNMINSFIEHIDNKFGFYENNTYYSNKDVDKFFKLYKKKLQNLYDITNRWNYEFYKDDDIDPELMDKYLAMQDIVTINHFKGAEIYKKYQFYFNREAISDGGIDNSYTFEIIYNKTIDKENCILNIVSTTDTYIGSSNLPDNNNGEQISNLLNSAESSVTMKGSYTFIENTLREFIEQLLLIE
jgi:hypothetical protein